MKALVTAEMHADGLDALRGMGFDVRHAGWGVTRQALGPDAYADLAAGSTLLLTEIETVDAAVLDACPDLVAVGTARGGPVNVDIQACTERGVPVLFAPGRNAESVADFTVGMIISLVRGLVAGDRHLRSPGWAVETGAGASEVPYLHFRGPELSRLRVGLVGFGAVGRAVSRRLTDGFGTRVVFHDPAVAGSTALEELLAGVDVVSLHCPRTPQTDRLMRAETLRLLRPGAFVVNTAGGGCVDAEDLVAALEAGHVAGAALDVFDVEPLPDDSGLRGRPDVVLTPHLAGAADDVVRHHTAMLLADVERIRHQQPPQHCANPEVLEGRS